MYLKDLIRDNVDLINDRKTINQCLTFVKNKEGKYEAIEGKHDDKVMSLGIALYSRSQQTFDVPKAPIEIKFKWSEDLKEDYRRASKEIKERMLDKYGQIN